MAGLSPACLKRSFLYESEGNDGETFPRALKEDPPPSGLRTGILVLDYRFISGIRKGQVRECIYENNYYPVKNSSNPLADK